jgi:hypothetical protein
MALQHVICIVILITLSGCSSRRVSRDELTAMVSKPKQPYFGWIYKGSTDSDHFLTGHGLGILFVPHDHFVISSNELFIPRTYTRSGKEGHERIFVSGMESLPDYELKLSSDRAVLTAVMSNGKPRWVREYFVDSDGRCLPHGEWKQYDLSGRLKETTEYRHGTVSGKHWIKLDWHRHGARELESYWSGREPVGIWRIDPDDVNHIVIRLENGSEVLKEWFGGSYGKKVLLMRWENGRETYKGDWVRVAPPKVARKSVYLGKDLHPDFAPEVTTVSELRGLTTRPASKRVESKG